MINFVNAFAGYKVPTTNIVPVDFCTLAPGKTWDSGYYDKKNNVRQSYNFQESMTTITDRPCGSCKFTATLELQNHMYLSSVTGVYRENKYFNAKSTLDTEYNIEIKRGELTAVTSYHTGDWYIMKVNPWESIPTNLRREEVNNYEVYKRAFFIDNTVFNFIDFLNIRSSKGTSMESVRRQNS